MKPTKHWAMRWLGRLVTLGLFGVIAGLAVIVVVVYKYSADLPDHAQLSSYSPDMVTRLYAADGHLLAQYATQNRAFVPFHAIPKRAIHAFLSAEDQHFYLHPGLDFLGIGRAIFTNIANAGRGRGLVGGSTITQQVVKNFLLTNEKSFERKIKEAILAFRIEGALTKDQILELYLNEIYLGGGTYGVAAASLHYFNKSIDELNIEEAAYLAALPKAPAYYDPRKNYNRAKERRDWVIGRMEEDGYITEAEAEAAKATVVRFSSEDTTTARAEFFAEDVRRFLKTKYGYDGLYKAGMTVRTTLDPRLQAIAEASLRQGLIAYDRRHGYRKPYGKVMPGEVWQQAMRRFVPPVAYPSFLPAAILTLNDEGAVVGLPSGQRGVIPAEELRWSKGGLAEGDVVLTEPLKGKPGSYSLQQIPQLDGALVALDPHTGRVRAMVGGADYTKTEYNRATQAFRQPGSAFKPFIYVAALENGFTPSSVMVDRPITIHQEAGLPVWQPKNYTDKFYGPTTLREALEQSRNIPTVLFAQMTGLDKIQEIGNRMGVYDQLPKKYSAVLGAYETTLMRLTTAYASFVNGGKQIAPHMIERIQDRHGKTIYRLDDRACEGCMLKDGSALTLAVRPQPVDNRKTLLAPAVAYQITSILRGVVERGTAKKASELPYMLAGKTGTTNNSIDAWFIGFSPDLVVGVFTGFDTPRELGKKETGGAVALPIFTAFMSEALKGQPVIPFRIPSDVTLFKVDAKTGQPPTASTPTERIIFEPYQLGTSPETRYVPEPVEGGISEGGLAPNPYEGTPSFGGGTSRSYEAPAPAATPDSGASYGAGGLY